MQNGAITPDGLVDLKTDGWEYDGISWCCPSCADEEGDG